MSSIISKFVNESYNVIFFSTTELKITITFVLVHYALKIAFYRISCDYN